MPPSPGPVTIVVGPESLLVDRAVDAVVRSVRAGDPDVDVREAGGAGLNGGAVGALTSPSLFGDRYVIVLRDVQTASDEVLAELAAYVAAPADDVVLVLTHAKGPRGKRVLDAARAAGAAEVACAEVKTRRDRVAFVSTEFASHRRRAPAEAVETLVDAVGGDLRDLAAAVSQLCADTSGTVDLAAVQRYYAGYAEASGFVVADRAVEGRTDQALRQLRYAVGRGIDPVLVVAALAMSLRNLVAVATASPGLREADLAREVGLPPWKVRSVRGQLRGWDAEGIARALTAVAEADVAVKGGVADPLYAVERAVVTVAQLRSRSRR